MLKVISVQYPNRYPRGASADGVISLVTDDVSLTASRTLTAADKMFYQSGDAAVVVQTIRVLHGTPATAITITVPDDEDISIPGTYWQIYVDEAQVGAVTIARQTNGTLNDGTGAITVVAGGFATIYVKSNTADTPDVRVSGDITSEQTIYGNVDFNDKLLKRPALQDHQETNTTNATATGSITYDYRTGSVANMTLTGNVTALAFSNLPAAGYCGSVTFIITQGGSGGYSWAHPSGTKWSNGVAPTLTTTLGAISIITYVIDGAGTIYGFLGGTAFA